MHDFNPITKTKKENENSVQPTFQTQNPYSNSSNSNSDSQSRVSLMVPYSSAVNFTTSNYETSNSNQSASTTNRVLANGIPPPYGPGGQLLLNKSSTASDGSGGESENYLPYPNDLDKLHTSERISFPGIYSSTGFDVLSILVKLINRPNPTFELGPVDMNTSFIVVDARKFDFPIIYSSSAFEALTGYKSTEIIGRNCRFLQSPDGHVSLGSRRRYTDNNVVHKMKSGLVDGKEFQGSIVNYKKNSQPFINFVTMIPIYEANEILYYVGFQVDLVEQPNTILERVKDGTYKVNYSMLSIPRYLSAGMDDFFPGMPYSNSFQNAADAYEAIVGTPRNEESHRIWNKMLIEHADDFIYVLTLKGIFLYASPSCKEMLGYDPEELIGYSVSLLCHSSDLVPMMRELKEASTDNSFCLIYRARRKDGSYVWMETIGSIHNDNGKGRKCVVLSGRVRPVIQLSREALISCGGLAEKEFWTKLSLDGMFLHINSQSSKVVGFSPDELIGTSMYQYMRSDRTTALTRALHQTRVGVTVRLRHFFKDKCNNFGEFASTFYPGDSFNDGKPAFILCQTRPCEKLSSSETSSNMSFSSSSAPSPCTNRAASEYDNLFDIIDTKRTTTWQYELHQLNLANKKMKDEIKALTTVLKTKRKREIANTGCSSCQNKESTQWFKDSNSNSYKCLDCYSKKSKTSSSNNSSGTGVGPRSTSNSTQNSPPAP